MTRSGQRKPNVRDVARAAGVSVATVSRVLNRSSLVSNAMRTRVEQAMDSLQFVPSSAARAINSGRTHLVGALVPTLDHAIFARFIENVEETLDTRGLSLIVANTRYDAERELEKTRKLLDIGVEGLIVSGTTRAAGFDKVVERYKMPVVSTSCYKPDHSYPTIGYDNAAVAREALDYLVSLGHRDIAVLSGPAHNNDRTQDRLSGVRSAGIARLHVVETELSFSGARDALRKIREHQTRFSALLCLSDVLAQGALLDMRRDAHDALSHLSIMGIDDLPTSARFDPPLSTIHLPVKEMGWAAANALADWLEHDIRPNSVKLDTRLIVRSSTFRYA